MSFWNGLEIAIGTIGITGGGLWLVAGVFWPPWFLCLPLGVFFIWKATRIETEK